MGRTTLNITGDASATIIVSNLLNKNKTLAMENKDEQIHKEVLG
jgi:Na+/H+-dicarboxylate symporter